MEPHVIVPQQLRPQNTRWARNASRASMELAQPRFTLEGCAQHLSDIKKHTLEGQKVKTPRKNRRNRRKIIRRKERTGKGEKEGRGMGDGGR